MNPPFFSLPRRRAFTLVELMVVVLIIGLLIGLVIPVVGKMRRSAAAAQSSAWLNAIRSAVDAYNDSYHAYPGPLSTDEMITGAKPATWPSGINNTNGSGVVTSSENMTLGLLGGLALQGPGQVKFDPQLVGDGPKDLIATASGGPMSIGGKPAFLSDFKSKISAGSFNGSGPGTVVSGSSVQNGAFDTNVPELVDTFNDPLPIIYLRAARGRQGVLSDSSIAGGGLSYQYDVRQYAGYLADSGGAPLKLYGKSQGNTNGKGIFTVEPTVTALQPPAPYTGLAYFINPSIPPSNAAQANLTGTPRAKDGYILICAGGDRIFGTADDITSFGSVNP